MAKQSRKLNEEKLTIIKEKLEVGTPLDLIAQRVGMKPRLLHAYIGSVEYDDDPWVQRLRKVYHEASMKLIMTLLGVLYKRAVGGGTVRTCTVSTMGDPIIIDRTLPPDAKVAQRLLERRFPEYFAARARHVEEDAESYNPNEAVVLAVGAPEGAASADHPFGKGRKMAKQSWKLNEGTLAIIEESLRIGASLKLIAPCVGMKPALLRAYIRSEEYDDDPLLQRLRDVYHKANFEFVTTMLKVIVKRAEGGGTVRTEKTRHDGRVTIYTKTLPPDAEATQWLLERRFPEYFAARARRVEDDAESYNPNQAVVLAVGGGLYPPGRGWAHPLISMRGGDPGAVDMVVGALGMAIASGTRRTST